MTKNVIPALADKINTKYVGKNLNYKNIIQIKSCH